MTQELLFSMRKVILDGMRITFLNEKSNSRCWSMTKLWSVPTSFKEKLSDLEKLFIWSLIQAIGSGLCSCFLQSWLFIFQLFLVVCIFRSKLGVDDTALFEWIIRFFEWISSFFNEYFYWMNNQRFFNGFSLNRYFANKNLMNDLMYAFVC